MVRVWTRHQSLSRSTPVSLTRVASRRKATVLRTNRRAGYHALVPDLLRWSDHLAALSLPSLSDLPSLPGASAAQRAGYARAFRDTTGGTREVDVPLLARLLEFVPDSATRSQRPEVLLWWALHDRSIDPMSLVPRVSGPLVPDRHQEGIEAWTEAELCALHALTHLALDRGAPELRQRCVSAVRWHLAEVQPDNATNRPWAVHAFVLASRELPEAMMHAGTLVHNSMVGRHHPERLSAVLLLDASKALLRPEAQAF